MSKKHKQLLFALAAIVILTLILLHERKPPVTAGTETARADAPAQALKPRPAGLTLTNVGSTNGPPTRQVPEIRARAEHVQRDSEREIELWQSPVLYFGKVFDENGVPIPGVQVSYGANSMNESREEVYNKGSVTTDERGIFKIDGVKGIGLMLQLSHPNYYPYPENSTGFDKRSLPRRGSFSDSEEKAKLFRMHSKGHPVPLISREGGLHVSADGTIATFPFRGGTTTQIIGQGQIQGWKGSPDAQSDGHYDWKVNITVSSGGVLVSTNYFDFIAPEAGYQESFEISMSKNDPNWQAHVEKRFFFKLADHFVRANVSIDLHRDLYFSINYFVNPDGSRNLEPAEAKPTRRDLPPGVTEVIPDGLK